MKPVENLGKFADVAAVLETAITQGTITYELPDRAKAIKFRHRCYSYRTALRRHDQRRKGEDSGLAPASKFDQMEITIHPSNPALLVIRAIVPKGILRGPDGSIIDPLRATPIEATNDEADLLAAAIELLDN